MDTRTPALEVVARAVPPAGVPDVVGNVASAVNDVGTLIRPKDDPPIMSAPARSSLEACAFVAPFARSNAARP